ncbi:hypothetical protein DVA67_011610 [Solirubrobacter sp. CPCC 204708]|uniref:BPP domain-containing protein n=1 Tax=Solirubrobacter deserti TaxID=2282478 RepID=A0ABT4RPN8_9ACTN|nr:hypothetical protein [Solirubrobacter deserti]MBE2316626.1 hypothetical protein [Solirubrobacter deserti]MDA0140524.1 hypothetical protein [Solirubrobacter deserti]
MLALAAPAAAAPPWSPPVAIPAADVPPRLDANTLDQASFVPHVSAGKFEAGPQLVWWRGGEDSRVLVALNGTQTLRVRTSRSAVAASRYAQSRVLTLDARIPDRDNLERRQLGYRIGDAGLSSLGAVREIGGPRSIASVPQLAVNADGAAIAAWRHIVRGRSDEVQVSYRPAGGRFSEIRTLANTGIDPDSIVGVGIDTGDRAIVAYSRDRQLAVRVIRVKTGWTSAEARVAPPGGQRGPVEIVVGTGEPGIAVVAWRAYPVTEGPTGHVDAAAAILPNGSNRPRPAVSLAEGDLVGYPRGPIAATVDATGRPVVAWTVPARPGVSVPTAAIANQAGVFGPPVALDSSGSIGSLIRVGDGVAVSWLRETPGPEGHGSPLGVFASLTGPDGAFGPPELIDDASRGTGYDGLQPPGLGMMNNGRALAVYADINANAAEGEARVSAR